MYTVDLSEGLNRDYRSDVSNSNATNASELKISGTTLVHFKNGKIVEYIGIRTDITHIEETKEYLKNQFLSLPKTLHH